MTRNIARSIALFFMATTLVSASPLDSAQEQFQQAVALERSHPEKAIAAYEQVAKRFGKNSPPAMRILAARALLNKGGVFGEQNNVRDAIYTYDRIEYRFGQDTVPEVREVLASSLVSKAEAFYRLGNIKKTLALYEELNQRFGKDDNDLIKNLIDITRWRIAEIQVINDTVLSSRP